MTRRQEIGIVLRKVRRADRRLARRLNAALAVLERSQPWRAGHAPRRLRISSSG
jgi:hypothetical protein